MYNKETIELLEGVLGDAINKQKFVRNANKLNSTGMKIQKDNPDLENYFQIPYKKRRNMEKYAAKALKAEENLKKNPMNADWLDKKSNDIYNKYTSKFEEAACILIEALNTLLNE